MSRFRIFYMDTLKLTFGALKFERLACFCMHELETI